MLTAAFIIVLKRVISTFVVFDVKPRNFQRTAKVSDRILAICNIVKLGELSVPLKERKRNHRQRPTKRGMGTRDEKFGEPAFSFFFGTTGRASSATFSIKGGPGDERDTQKWRSSALLEARASGDIWGTPGGGREETTRRLPSEPRNAAAQCSRSSLPTPSGILIWRTWNWPEMGSESFERILSTNNCLISTRLKFLC